MFIKLGETAIVNVSEVESVEIIRDINAEDRREIMRAQAMHQSASPSNGSFRGFLDPFSNNSPTQNMAIKFTYRNMKEELRVMIIETPGWDSPQVLYKEILQQLAQIESFRMTTELEEAIKNG
jgi:hypothetical protein